MTAQALYYEASRHGLRLERRGDKLAVIPASRCPPELADVLRQHKRELLELLDPRAANHPADCAPWLHIAQQVLAGEFDGADRSMIESLTIGLRGIRHALCQEALERLNRQRRTKSNDKP
jgi:hypothetical protein